MTGRYGNKRHRANRKTWHSLPRDGGILLLVALLVSVSLHLLSGINLSRFSPRDALESPKSKQDKVNIRVVDKKPPKPSPKILETPQKETEKPDDARYAGKVDHKTEKETKLPDNVKREKAAAPGQKGNPNAQKAKPQQAQKKKPKRQPKPEPQSKPKTATSQDGTIAFDENKDKPERKRYEKVLPTKMQDLPGQVDAGYQDYVDEKVAEGQKIDINTTKYRYIGYFTSMRKAIELVWTYPREASRRGLQGEVDLEFAIEKDGQARGIKVVDSSGHEVLDEAIVEAIRLASPFSPLPEGFDKNRIVVTGSFRYVLSSYGTH